MQLPARLFQKRPKKINLKENDWLGLIPQCTEVRFASFFSGVFITAIQPPERILAKRISVQCAAQMPGNFCFL